MRFQLSLLIGGLVAASTVTACATGTSVQAAGDVASATPSTASYLPVGTTFEAKLNQTLGTSTSHDGDNFTATVTQPVMATDGSTAVAAGATISGHVTGLHNPKIPGEQAVIRLDFENLTTNSRSYPFNGSISNVNVQKQSTGSNTSTTVRDAVTGAAAGAVLGTILGGVELSKIVTGGLLGAAAGTVISLGTGGSESVIPAGSAVTIKATQPVKLR
jgi:hypothetical protein